MSAMSASLGSGQNALMAVSKLARLGSVNDTKHLWVGTQLKGKQMSYCLKKPVI
jgi:hypothetical protein